METPTVIKEGSTSYQSISFTDKNGAAIPAPSAVRYKVCTDTGAVLVPWTNLNPPDIGEIEISAEVNTIGRNGRKRFLTVEATHGIGKKITTEFVYELEHLAGF